MKMLETIHILPVRAESAAPAPLRGKKLDQRAVLQVVRKVDWKKAGLIAGGAVRAILELAGVKDVLAKSLGAANAANVAKATFKAISQLSSREEVYARRGIPMPQAAQVAAPVAENN